MQNGNTQIGVASISSEMGRAHPELMHSAPWGRAGGRRPVKLGRSYGRQTRMNRRVDYRRSVRGYSRKVGMETRFRWVGALAPRRWGARTISAGAFRSLKTCVEMPEGSSA